MKALLNITLAATLLAGSAFAQEMADTTREINAQTTITRTAVENVIARMGSGNAPTQFNANDYRNEAAEFRSELDYSMKRFEDRLSKEVLAQAAFWMNQYNSIYTSKEFSEIQKQNILKERLIHIQNQFSQLSSTYQEILKEAYSIVPALDGEARVDMRDVVLKCRKNQHRFSTSTSFSAKLSVGKKSQTVKGIAALESVDCGSSDIVVTVTINNIRQDIAIKMPKYDAVLKGSFLTGHLGLHKDVYQKHYYPKIKGECRSTICMGLKSADYSSLINLIKTNIDKNITLKLADGNGLTIYGLNKEIGLLNSLLSRVDYPEQLPFDI